MDVYRISCASWVTISRSLKFSNLWRKVRTVWRQRIRFRLGIGAIFHSDHNERRAPPCVRYTCNVHSESENKSQMICESRRLLWLVIWSWRPITKTSIFGAQFFEIVLSKWRRWLLKFDRCVIENHSVGYHVINDGEILYPCGDSLSDNDNLCYATSSTWSTFYFDGSRKAGGCICWYYQSISSLTL